MSPLAQAIDDLFADPNFAAEAVYLPESGESISVRFLARRPDRELEFGAACPSIFPITFYQSFHRPSI